MRKHRKLLIVLACLAVVAGVVVFATRDNERAAQSFSIGTTRAKLTAFTASGAIAGVAGGLFVHLTQSFELASYGPGDSLDVFIATVVGGLGSVGERHVQETAEAVGSQVAENLREVLDGEFNGVKYNQLILVVKKKVHRTTFATMIDATVAIVERERTTDEGAWRARTSGGAEEESGRIAGEEGLADFHEPHGLAKPLPQVVEQQTVLGKAELGVTIVDGERVLPRPAEELAVLQQIRHPEGRHPALAGAEVVAWTPQLEVDLGDPEAVSGRVPGAGIASYFLCCLDGSV